MSKYISRTIIVFLLMALGVGLFSYRRLLEKYNSSIEQGLGRRDEHRRSYNDVVCRNSEFSRAIELAAMLHITKSVDGRYPTGEELLNLYYSPGTLLGYMGIKSDLWGMPYRCETIPILASSGLDGVFDTEDDIFVRIESQAVSNLLFEIKSDIPDIEDEFRNARKVHGWSEYSEEGEK